MKDIIIKKIDNVWLHVDSSPSILMELNDYFAFFTDGYMFSPKFKQKIWDGKIRLFQSYTGRLPIGLYYQLIKFCKLYGYTLDSKVELKYDSIGFDEWLNELPVSTDGKGIKPRDYQYNAIKKILFEPFRGLLECPTSSGKSLIQYISSRWCMKSYDGKILITVPTTALVLQMRQDFLDYSEFDDSFSDDDIHIIMSGKEKNSKTARIIISTWQSISKLPKKWFDQFDGYMADEGHLATAKNLTDIVQKLDNCPVKAGLSGTFKDSQSHLLSLTGHFGHLYRPVTTRELMDAGTISELKIKVIALDYTKDECKKRKKMNYQTEIKFITGDKKRNAILVGYAVAMAKKGKNIVLMFKHIKHGKILLEMCEKHHDNVHFVAGETDVEVRDALRPVAESSDGMIIVASLGVFSTGVNIKKLHGVIMAHPLKSKILILQSIGRILRKHKDKDKAFFFDFVDNIFWGKWKCHSLKHGTERIKLYNSQKLDYTISKVAI